MPFIKKIVELMGGSITMESEYGKGSVFTAKIHHKLLTDTSIGPVVVENLYSFKYNDNKRMPGVKPNRIWMNKLK